MSKYTCQKMSIALKFQQVKNPTSAHTMSDSSSNPSNMVVHQYSKQLKLMEMDQYMLYSLTCIDRVLVQLVPTPTCHLNLRFSKSIG